MYLVLEYADKGDLLGFINSSRPDEPGIGEKIAKKLFKQLVQGLDHCHRRNIVHRSGSEFPTLHSHASTSFEQNMRTSF